MSLSKQPFTKTAKVPEEPEVPVACEPRFVFWDCCQCDHTNTLLSVACVKEFDFDPRYITTVFCYHDRCESDTVRWSGSPTGDKKKDPASGPTPHDKDDSGPGATLGEQGKRSQPHASLGVNGQDNHTVLEPVPPPLSAETVAQESSAFVQPPASTDNANATQNHGPHSNGNNGNGNHTPGTSLQPGLHLSPSIFAQPPAFSENNAGNLHPPMPEQPAQETDTNGHGSTSHSPQQTSTGNTATPSQEPSPETSQPRTPSNEPLSTAPAPAPLLPGSLPAAPTIGGPSKLTIRTDPADQERRRHEIHSAGSSRPRRASGNPFDVLSDDQHKEEEEKEEGQDENEEA